MRKIAIVNNKGGVAKTTNTMNIGAGLARMGKRVLLIDFDIQGNLTTFLGVKDIGTSTIDIMNEKAKIEDAIIHTNINCDLLPTPAPINEDEPKLSDLNRTLLAVTGHQHILLEAIEPIENNYDYILIDCQPDVKTALSENAFVACNEVFISIMPEYAPAVGASQLIGVIQTAQKRLNRNLKITGVVFSKVKGTNLSKSMKEMTISAFGDIVFKSTIGDYVDVATAPGYAMSIFDYNPNSIPAAQYKALCDEIIAQEASNG
jgi:chromosome partitioning protein